jgi:hypothetical protein
MWGKDIFHRVGGSHGELVRVAPPVTLPALEFLQKGPPPDIEAVERRQVAAKFLEARIIKSAAECWQAYGRASSFEAF